MELCVFCDFVFLSARPTEHNVCSVCGLCYDRVSFIGLHVHLNVTERTRKHWRGKYISTYHMYVDIFVFALRLAGANANV